MGTVRKPRIFLSRTTRGLASIARDVSQLLRDRGFEVVHQPELGLGWRRIRHKLMDEIRECDCAICLVGPALGECPKEPLPELRDPCTGRDRFSYTQLELLLARRLHKPVITILLADSFPYDSFQQADADRQLQQDFIQEYVLGTEYLYRSYTSKSSLLADLRAAEIPLTASLLPRVSPSNVPFDSIGTLLVGREAALGGLRRCLHRSDPSDANPRVVILQGLGGAGKTRLSVEHAHRLNAEYSARFFLRADNPGALETSLAQLCGFFYLNLEEQDEDSTSLRAEAVLRWLRSHPGYLIVIDGVDTADARGEVLSLIPRLQHAHVIVSSRLHSWPGNLPRLHLDVLPAPEGALLLRRYRGPPKAPAANDEAEALALARDLDGLPLAIEQAAAFLAVNAYTIAEYRALWTANARRVQRWPSARGGVHAETVATTWLTTYQQLDRRSRILLKILSWLAPEPIPRTLLDCLRARGLGRRGFGGGHARTALGRLMEFSLVKVASEHSFSVHRLVQHVARARQNKAATPSALATALDSLASFFDGHSDDARRWTVLVPLLPHAIGAARFGDERGGLEPTSRILSGAALLLHAQANYRAAKPLYRRALAIDRRRFGGGDPRVASSLAGLGQVLWYTSSRGRAEPLMRRALDITEANYPSSHPLVALALSNFAQLLVQSNRLEEAEPMMRRALAIDERWFGAEHPNVARDLNNLAQLLAQSDRLEEAEPMMRRALAIDHACLGSEHPSVARDLNNLAQLLADTGGSDEAEELFRKAAELDEAAYGPVHPRLATDLSNLAQILVHQNRMIEAEPLVRRALAIEEKCFGPAHERVATALCNLAQLLIETNRDGEAESALGQALEIWQSTFGVDDPSVARTLLTLGRLAARGGRYLQAEAALRNALEVDERCFGMTHAAVGSDLESLGGVLHALGRSAEAEALLRRALVIREQVLGASHSEVARSLVGLGQLLREVGRADEAEPLVIRALKIDEESLGSDDPVVVADLKSVADVLEARGHLEEAVRYVLLALQIDQDRFGMEHPDVKAGLDRVEKLQGARSIGRGEGDAEITARPPGTSAPK